MIAAHSLLHSNAPMMKLLRWALALCLATLCLVLAGCKQPFKACTTVFSYTPTDYNAEPIKGRTLPHASDDCTAGRIAILDVDGILVNRNISGPGTMNENPLALFREKLDAAACDPCLRALVLRINSPGGGVTACDIMRQDLENFRQKTGVPVVSCVMDVGAGGAYLLATQSDMVIAHPTSVVGGIGVVLNLYNLRRQLQERNIGVIVIRAGENIDMGSPIAEHEEGESLTEDQKKILDGMAKDFHQRFIDSVSQARRLDPKSKKLFDGRIFSGEDARDAGLVDQLGYFDDALEEARRLAGLDGAAQVVILHRPNDRANTPYDITHHVPLSQGVLPLSIPGLDRSTLPTFLYLWQPEPTMDKSVP